MTAADPAAGPAAAPASGSEAGRLDALERHQAATDTKLDQILAAIGGGTGQARDSAQGAVQGRLAAPGDLPAQIQAELDRRDQATKAAEREAATGSRLDALERRTAATADRPPAQPERRVTRVMFGPRDT